MNELERILRGASGPLVVPGLGTALEARAAIAAGFPSIYVSGYATAAWRHGVPDIGLIAAAEIEASLRAVAAVASVPVIVDVDTGYGDVVNVGDTVRRLAAAGAAAVQIEDQTWPKRCGHLEGKSVEPLATAARKIRAAVHARGQDGPLIVARTDARATDGLDEAIRRAGAFAEEGADILFIDAPESLAEVERIAEEVPGRRLINMSESGRTPTLSREDFARLGIEIVLYPTSALRIASQAMTRFFEDLALSGDSEGWRGRMHELGELNALVGLAGYRQAEEAALASSEVVR